MLLGALIARLLGTPNAPRQISETFAANALTEMFRAGRGRQETALQPLNVEFFAGAEGGFSPAAQYRHRYYWPDPQSLTVDAAERIGPGIS